MTHFDWKNDRLEQAARKEAERQKFAEQNPEPSLGARLGQIGMLGWVIVLPALFFLWLGRVIDQWLSTGIMFSACFLMLGLITGFWYAWRWMHKS